MERSEAAKKSVVAAAAVFACAMVIFPQVTEEGAKSAMLIWANSIVPVLLPFFIFSDFIKRTGELRRLPARIYPFAVAFLSGYPMGAKAAADCIRSGQLTPEEGRRVMSFSMVTGPAFILFTVGEFLGSERAALLVAIAHYGGSLLNGALHALLRAGEDRGTPLAKKPPAACENAAEGYFTSFTRAIFDGFHAMAAILAYLIFFTIGISLLQRFGFFGLMKSELIASLFKGFLEMTVGVNGVGLCDAALWAKTAAAAAVVSFGGLSVIGQSCSVAQGAGVSFGEIFFMKLMHGMLAAIIAVIFSPLML